MSAELLISTCNLYPIERICDPTTLYRTGHHILMLTLNEYFQSVGCIGFIQISRSFVFWAQWHNGLQSRSQSLSRIFRPLIELQLLASHN